MPIKPSLGALGIIALLILTLANLNSNLGIAVVFLLIVIVAQNVIGDMAILCFLAIRPGLDYWRDFTVLSIQNHDLNINAAVSILLLAWSIIFFIRHRQYWRKIPLKIPWLLFIAWCAISALYSFDLTATIQETIRTANLFALFAVAYVSRLKQGEKFYHRVLLALALSAIIPIGLALYQLFIGAGMRIDEVNNRIYGAFAHPNVLSTYALMLVMVATEGFARYQRSVKKILKLIPNKKQYDQLIYSAIIAFCAAIIIFTYTRISWIGLAAFFAIILLVWSRRLLLYCAGATILFYLLIYPLNNFLIGNFNVNIQTNALIARLTTRNLEFDSIAWRLELINNILPLYWQRPIIGYGYGAFSKVWDVNKSARYLYDAASEAHNDYLKIAFETGAIGLLFFIAIFTLLLHKQIAYGLKNNWKNIAFIASVVVYLILSASDNMLHHTPTIWWLWFIWGSWQAEYNN